MGLLYLALFVTGAASVALFSYRAHRATSELKARLWQGWHQAAGRVGLEVSFDATSRADAVALRAHFRGLEVVLEERPQAVQAATRITVSGLGHGAGGLSVGPRRLESRWVKHLGGEAIELGAPAFDEAFSIQGDPLLAQAVLDGETRSKLSRLLGGTLLDRHGKTLEVEASLAGSVLQVLVPHAREIPAEELCDRMTDVLGPVLDLAGRLVEPEDVAGRLAGNLGSDGRRSEPEAGVRLRCLRLLLRDFRYHPATTKVLVLLRDDPEEEIRLLVEIARGKADEPTLLERIEHPEVAMALVAAEALGQMGTAAAVPALRELAERGERELARAARQAIAEIQSRLEGAERGQLSLAGSEAGALSLAEETEPGRLSLAGGEAPAGERGAVSRCGSKRPGSSE